MRAGDRDVVLVANPGADLYGSDRMAVECVKALVGAGRRVVVTVPGPGPLIELFTEAGATVLQQPTPIIRRSLASPKGLLQLLRELLGTLWPSLRLLRTTGAGTVLVNTVTPALWFPLARLTGRHLVGYVHEAEGTASNVVRRARSTCRSSSAIGSSPTATSPRRCSPRRLPRSAVEPPSSTTPLPARPGSPRRERR